MNKTVIVTGASSGIGQATAELLAAHGHPVILAARRKDRLQQLADRINAQGGKALPVPTDLEELGQIQSLVDQAFAFTGRIDVLVNNAGFGRLLWLDEQEFEKDIASQIQVNLTGAIYLTRAVLPVMLEQNNGHIICMSSISAYIGVPTYSIYTATKFGLRGFAESLRREVRGRGVRVSSIYPGGVDTEFDLHAGVHWETTRVTPKWLLLSPEEVAEMVRKVLKTGQKRLVVPQVMNLAIWANHFFPAVVGWILGKYFYRDAGKTVAWNQREEK